MDNAGKISAPASDTIIVDSLAQKAAV